MDMKKLRDPEPFVQVWTRSYLYTSPTTKNFCGTSAAESRNLGCDNLTPKAWARFCLSSRLPATLAGLKEPERNDTLSINRFYRSPPKLFPILNTF